MELTSRATLASLIGGATNKGVYINLDLSGSGITYIPDGAFNADTNSALATYLRGVVVPNGVTCIGHNAFKGCTNLSGNVTIPTACTDLGQAIFAGTNVTSLTDAGGRNWHRCWVDHGTTNDGNAWGPAPLDVNVLNQTCTSPSSYQYIYTL